MSKFFLFLLLTLTSQTFAQNEWQCSFEKDYGVLPSALKTLVNVVYHIDKKCNDEFLSYKKEVEKELDQVSNMEDELWIEINKVAVKAERRKGVVICPDDQVKAEACRELLRKQGNLADHHNALLKWLLDNESYFNKKEAITSSTRVKKEPPTAPPCPSTELLIRIKPYRYFNKNLYKAWERCPGLHPEDFSEVWESSP